MLQDSGIEVLTKSKGSKIIKILWIIAICASFYGLTFYIRGCYKKLKIVPEILVNEEYIHGYEIPFPAITICPPVFVKSEFLNVSKLNDDLLNNKTINLEDQLLIPSSIHACSNNPNRNILTQSLKILRNKTFDENVAQTLDKIAPQISETFVRCEVNEFNGCDNIFVRSLTDYGYCFTFNLLGYHEIFNLNVSSDFNAFKRRKIVKDWSVDAEVEYHNDENDSEKSPIWILEDGYPMNGSSSQPLRATKLQYLLVRMKVNRSDIQNVCVRMSDLYRIFIHLPNEIPSTMHSYTVTEFEKLKLSRITARVKNIGESLKDFAPVKRGCYLKNERQLRFFKAYTKNNCEYECMTNFRSWKCGCVKFSMPRTEGQKICQIKDIKCFSEITKNWPGSFYKEYKNSSTENLLNLPCSCLPSCTEIKYEIVTEHIRDIAESSTNIHKFAGVRMIFIDSQIIKTTNYITYGLQNFIADIGGLVGLFLGFSLLSLFDLILKTFLFIGEMMKKLRNRTEDFQIHQTNEITVETLNREVIERYEERSQYKKNNFIIPQSQSAESF